LPVVEWRDGGGGTFLGTPGGIAESGFAIGRDGEEAGLGVGAAVAGAPALAAIGNKPFT